MRVSAIRIVKFVLFAPLLVLFGCQGFFSPPAHSAMALPTGMNLVGNWDFYMRSESNATNIVHGMLVITEENCSQGVVTCPIRGYLEIVVSSSKVRFAISGFSYPQAPLVRFSFTTGSTFGEPLQVIVEFDSFPKQLVPAHSMAGYAIKFNQASPGEEYVDSSVLGAAGRGMAIEAGRASAWPSTR